MKTKILSIAFVLAIIYTGTIPVTAQMTTDEASQYGKYGKDSIQCVINISLYREFFKQWKNSGYKNETINDAIGPWRWVFMNCPKGTENTYVDGVKIMSFLIDKEADEAVKNKYIDSLMMVYDQRISFYAKEGYVLGRKGVDLYKYRPENYKEVFNILKKSVDLEGNKSAGPVVVYYFRAAMNMVKNGKADTSIIVDIYDQLSTIIDYNLANSKKPASWEIVKGNIDGSFEPVAKCENLIPVFRKKFEATPDDLDLLKKITSTLDKKKCQGDPLYFETTEKLYALEPSPASAYLIGKMLLKQERYSDAIEYLKQSEGMEDKKQVAKANKYIAEAYRALRNFPTARKYALQSYELNPEDGEVFIIIGDMYAESAKDCGNNDLTKLVAYWVAVDKYYKAKRVDPDLEEIANNRISSYSRYFPSTEVIFFHNLQDGESYLVECWINENTKVRAAK